MSDDVTALLDLHLPQWTTDPRAARLQAKAAPPRLRALLIAALDVASPPAAPKSPVRRVRRSKKD
jgi:hypothetical protein